MAHLDELRGLVAGTTFLPQDRHGMSPLSAVRHAGWVSA